MRLVVQRVHSAWVEVQGERLGEIGQGLLVFAALAPTDTLDNCQKAIDKIHALRLFDDEGAFLVKSIEEIAGGILLVSQFTLLANVRKGRRPSFSDAMPPILAEPLFAQFVELWRGQFPQLQCGRFGADMQVSLVNDGPITLVWDI